MLFPKDPHFSEADAHEFIDPIVEQLRRCVNAAFSGYCRACAAVEELGPALDYLGSRATTINALVVEHIRREFSEKSAQISTSDENGFLELQLRHPEKEIGVDVRFKMMIDRAGHTQNTVTEIQWRYRNQLPLIGNGDAHRIARVTLGWRWNVAVTALEDIAVVYAKGDDPIWKYSILESDQPPDSLPVPAPKPQPYKGGGAKFISKQSKAKRGKDAPGSA